MNEVELSNRRRQMGRSLEVLSSAGPKPLCEDGPGYWMALSGVASSDANVALLDTDDPATQRHVLGVIDESELPVTVVLAGPARTMSLGERWRHQGDMPLMTMALSSRELPRDSRVRAATARDVEDVSGLLASAYAIRREESDAVAAFAATRRDDGTIWLLVDEHPVATVFTAVIDDAVCVWSLATPEQYGRRGYARALLDDVLARSRDAGALVGLLGATPAGEPLYSRAGWRTVETWQLFTRSHETP